jgi:hypothetical protein
MHHHHPPADNRRRRARWARLAALAAVMITVMTGALVAARPTPAEAAATCTGYSHFNPNQFGELHAPTIGNHTGQYYCDLARGNRGVAVLVLQESLRYCFKHGIATDGIFGPNTQAAMAATTRSINDFYDTSFPTNGRYYADMALYMSWARFGPGGGPHVPDQCGFLFGP